MPDILQAALEYPGAAWIALAAFVAGTVRGFSGFGTALIFLPIAALFVSPVWALILLIGMDLLGPIPLLQQTMRQAHKRDLVRLMVGVWVVLPFSLLLLYSLDPKIFRYGVSVIALLVVAALVLGYQYRGDIRRHHVVATGAAGGFLGGVAALPGPPVILFYMARDLPASVIRANIFLYLYLFDLTAFVVIGLQGRLEAVPLVMGVLLAIPTMAGNFLGTQLFRLGTERMYRIIAYLIVAASAIAGLPVWH
ncbi:sulfite exporter TauE/SafE family protein [Actibacterium pelagium]|uniref:Probable membrane transporter protein n=1 Tax=Actibacterium pelagium TaxID=2029103 RepID=A0A917EGZ8_9RHOB|nr:sulfite exporter TauE/SafE family protein [Actibacterium pelagium]GGE40182.1 membrane protein [Actibacterium pelagium]